MIKSMTGYGKGESTFGAGKMVVEIRSVNHRYGEVFVKLPRPLFAFENDVKKAVSGRLKRGKIEVFVQMDQGAGEGMAPAVNIALAQAYHRAFTSLREALNIREEVSLALLAAQRDVLSVAGSEEPAEELADDLISAVRAAIDELEAMRLKEGSALLEDFRGRRETLGRLVEKVAKRAPHVVSEYALRLKERIGQLLGESAIDEGRLAQEVAIMADRCDITEELVRFNSHLKQFDAILEMEEPVGRKLDFLLQEMNREVNTIGSKANDAEMAVVVVDMKAELEKIREQVQNIE